MKGKKPSVVELNAQELESLLDQIEEQLGEPTVRPLRLLLASYLELMRVIASKRASIRRLRRLIFGPQSERSCHLLKNDDQDGEAGEASAGDPPEPELPEDREGEPEKGANEPAADGPEPPASRRRARRARGHGRNAADQYAGCDQQMIHHGSLHPGDSCPHCQDGTLYRQGEWGQVVRLVAQPPIGGTRYQLERLRCGLCGKVETAELPPEAGPSKYDATVASMIAVLRYGLGLPWKRLEYAQRCAGIPLPASVQWDVVRQAVSAGLQAAYDCLVWLAAQGRLIYNDDTTMRVLQMKARLKQNLPLREDAPGRTGVFTTSILSEGEGRPPVVLFMTGSHHAGENLREVLLRRAQGLPPPIQMCDGLSRNLPAQLETIVAHCLAHARRKFVDIHESFPDQVRHVILSLKRVYRADALAKAFRLSPEKRLRLHQHRSGPVMDELSTWLKEQLAARQIEPNSSLGSAVSYMLKHWDRLTLFLRVAGAPLDSNAVERALKMAIRHRKNSMHYKTLNGAAVGDLYMSLIHSCYLAQVDPFDYLTTLQRHAAAVKADPSAWMPWNYRQSRIVATELTAAVKA